VLIDPLYRGRWRARRNSQIHAERAPGESHDQHLARKVGFTVEVADANWPESFFAVDVLPDSTLGPVGHRGGRTVHRPLPADPTLTSSSGRPATTRGRVTTSPIQPV
jgi:hypothetical protein